MLTSVEQKLTITLSPVQKLLVNRAIQIKQRLSAETSTAPMQFLSLGKKALIIDLIESGLRPQQIETLTGIALPSSGKEQENLMKSKTSGIIYQVDEKYQATED